MSSEILSIAIFEPLPGMEQESLATVQALSAALAKGGFSRDTLYREARPGSEFVLIRYWKSEEARRAAQEDPESLRCWAKLSQEIRTIRIYETLEEVAGKL
jgi:hypothetical protein